MDAAMQEEAQDNVVAHDVLRWLKLPNVMQSQQKANQAKRVVRANGKFVAGTEYGASR